MKEEYEVDFFLYLFYKKILYPMGQTKTRFRCCVYTNVQVSSPLFRLNTFHGT